MGRMRPEFVERVEAFCHRVMDVAEMLESANRSRRIVEQVVGAGTSIGANIAEADEAMSRADFCKCLSIASKEAAETGFWLRFVSKRNWVKASRTTDLQAECLELRRILGTMIKRTKRKVRPA